MSLNNVTPEDFGTWLISMHAESMIKSHLKTINFEMITNLLVGFYGTSSSEAEDAFYNGMLKVLGAVKDLEEATRPKPSKKLSVDNGVYDPDDTFFFIHPAGCLAHDVVYQVRSFQPDEWLVINGENILYYDDEKLSGELVGRARKVTLAPTQDPNEFWKYNGTFIRASDWIKEFENANADH